MALSTGNKATSVISWSVDRAARTLTANVAGAGAVTLHLSAVSDANRDYAGFHGFKQRLADAAAIGRDPATGKAAAPQVKLAAIAELVQHYESGTLEWSPVRSERVGSDEVMLARALAELRPDRTAERIREYVVGLRKAERDALLAKPEVRAIVDRLRGEAGSSVDTDALLTAL